MPYQSHSHRVRLCLVFIGVLGVLVPPVNAFELRGFADVSYQHDIHDNNVEENNGAFAIGPVDFYVAESLGPRMDVLTEIAFESGIVDLERLQISYLFSDALKVSAGRFHSSLGYWNTAYHHGAFLHTTIKRPFFLNFEDEGGVLPVHSVGLLASGRLFTDAGEFAYGAFVGNGSSISTGPPLELDPNNESDPNKNKAVGLRAMISPTGLHGWTVGASGYSSRVIDDQAPLTLDVTQTILGADAVYLNGSIELIAEYFLVRDKNKLGTDTTNNHLYYVQLGREFDGRVTPYVRHEQMSLDESDPYMDALSAIDNRTETAGVRVRVGDQSVLKFEGRFITDNGSDSHQEYGAQWAFAF
ncbi:MAG: hypothetical protein ACOYXR_14550 [Nitrospirota bacterium]